MNEIGLKGEREYVACNSCHLFSDGCEEVGGHTMRLLLSLE